MDQVKEAKPAWKAAALRRLFDDRLKIRIRSSRELAVYVTCTTALCAGLALAVDVANQLYFFEGWTAATRSWLITVALVVLIAVPVSRAIGKANLALYHASRTDPLTGLLNRRALLDNGSTCPAFVVLVIVDIDRFKQVNDTHGHMAGDEVLRTVSGLMRAALGNLGQIGRMGGEEFAILAAHAEPASISASLERFRAQVAATPILAGSIAVSVTISAGLAIRQPGQSFEQLYARADRALYLAKASGRNRIVCADDIAADLLPPAVAAPTTRPDAGLMGRQARG